MPTDLEFWHVYPLGFCAAPVWEEHSPAPRIEVLEKQLDYLISLGLNGLILGPVFASHTHGYDTIDYFRIDPRLGTGEDFDRFLAACSERGIKVLFDGVFSHVAADFVRPELIKHGEVFEGHEDLLRLDHSLPETADFVVDVMCHWLDRGIYGWRLDAAYSVPNEFWKPVLDRVREKHPEAYILGEVIHGDYAEIVSESGMDTVTQYELWKAIWSSLKDENFFELEWTLRRHNEFCETFIPQTFISNHDVTRIRTQVGAGKARLAAVILFTVPGVPSVYYGDELGFEGLKEERYRGDDEIRPAFPAHPEPNEVTNMYKALISLRRTNPWLVDARVEVDEVSNEALEYRVVSGDKALHVSLDLTEGEHATISDPFGSVLWGI